MSCVEQHKGGWEHWHLRHPWEKPRPTDTELARPRTHAGGLKGPVSSLGAFCLNHAYQKATEIVQESIKNVSFTKIQALKEPMLTSGTHHTKQLSVHI
jgi:hypothetical protein